MGKTEGRRETVHLDMLSNTRVTKKSRTMPNYEKIQYILKFIRKGETRREGRGTSERPKITKGVIRIEVDSLEI